MSKLRKLGDSNPRYGNPYVSLANWWFQPLTQTSFQYREPEGVLNRLLSLLAGAKVEIFCELRKHFRFFLYLCAENYEK